MRYIKIQIHIPTSSSVVLKYPYRHASKIKSESRFVYFDRLEQPEKHDLFGVDRLEASKLYRRLKKLAVNCIRFIIRYLSIHLKYIRTLIIRGCIIMVYFLASRTTVRRAILGSNSLPIQYLISHWK